MDTATAEHATSGGSGSGVQGRVPDEPYDIVIVGAGPVGLYAAYYAGFRGLRVSMVDSLEEPGGQVSAMYPEKLIYDVAGFPAVRGRDLVAGLVEQAGRYSPDYLLGTRAEELHTVSEVTGRPAPSSGLIGDEGDDGDETPADDLVLSLSGGERLRTRALLVTAGMGQFTPKPLPAADGWEEHGVIHFVRHPSDLTGQDVVIVGGGDSAFDWALMLADVARHVTLIHRRLAFRAHAGSVDAVREAGVRILAGYEVEKLVADETTGRVGAVDVVGRVPETKEERHVVPATTVIAALGFHADLGPLTRWGFELEKRAVAVDSRMATSRRRVYAAGDICTYPGKVKLIATGFGEAATAINNIAVDLDPTAHVFPGHSSG